MAGKQEFADLNADGSLSAAERGELDEYERLEHLGRMLKARVRQKQKL